jgi:hypothetical protein
MPEPRGSFICFFDEKYLRNISIIMGGFLLSKAKLFELDHAIARAKNSLGLDETDPIKWNMDDSNCLDSLRKMGGRERIPDLRRRLLAIAHTLPIRLLMSFLWIGDDSNQVAAWKWAFDNILQRLCIILDRKSHELQHLNNYPFMDVVFDNIPGRNKVKPYFDVYRDAYVKGYQGLPRGTLYPLRTYKACPCLVTSSCLHSLALQLADFLVGATGDFFEWCYYRKREQSVRDYFCNFYSAFHRGENNAVLGCGLIVKRPSQPFIRSKLRGLGLL